MRKEFLTFSIALVCSVFLSISAGMAEDKPGYYMVSQYHAAPGMQLDLLKWIARQDEIGAEVGMSPAQIYAHMDGANWDYLVINTIPTEKQNMAFEKAARKRGVSVGIKQGLEFRRMIMNHSDTSVRGPVTAADLVKLATE